MSVGVDQVAFEPPPEQVLAHFGLIGYEPTLLTDGQGRSWRVGKAVLKPLDQPVDALAWHSRTLRRDDHWAIGDRIAWEELTRHDR